MKIKFEKLISIWNTIQGFDKTLTQLEDTNIVLKPLKQLMLKSSLRNDVVNI